MSKRWIRLGLRRICSNLGKAGLSPRFESKIDFGISQDSSKNLTGGHARPTCRLFMMASDRDDFSENQLVLLAQVIAEKHRKQPALGR
jgi:hypothetical protein